jgi:DNA polymerase III epsilon subunit-like protein
MNRILIDTETTGLAKPTPCLLEDQPYIIEMYAVKIDDEFNMLDEFSSFFRPPIPISAEITKITGITDDMINEAGAKPFEDSYEKLCNFFLGTEELIGHNLPFDRSMMIYELSRIEKQYAFPWPPHQICTVEASISIEQRRLSLAALHQIATGKPHAGAHRAKADVFALVRCYHWLYEKEMVPRPVRAESV